MLRALFLFLLLLSRSMELCAIEPAQRTSRQKTPDKAVAFPDSSGIFPLNTGNLWQLRDATFNHLLESEVVGDTTFPNGETYTIVDGYGAGFGGRYVRQEGSRLLIYDDYDSTEVAIYDFAAEEGDTIGVMGDFTIILDNKRSVGFFGRTLTAWTFCVYFAEWITVVDSVGLYTVAYEPGILIYNFQGAIIDGIQYGTITDVIENATVPTRAQLSQNYPNPFNSISNFEFRISNSSDVSLKIFNLLGEEVAALVSGPMDAGTHTVQWDATGQPSGVYFCRLQAGEFVATRKLVLLR